MKNLIIFIFCSFMFGNSIYYQNLFNLSNTGYTEGYNTVNKIKSVIYSGFVPGSGQYFVNNQKTKGLLFLGIELIGWIAYSHYIEQAEKYRDEYQEFSLDYWSFASWCDHYYDFDNPDNHPNDSDYHPEWEQYRDLFSNEETGIYTAVR